MPITANEDHQDPGAAIKLRKKGVSAKQQDLDVSNVSVSSRGPKANAKKPLGVTIPQSWYTPRALTPDWEVQAVSFFFHGHTMSNRSNEVLSGYMEILPDFCNRQNCATYLTDALYAISLINIAPRTTLPWIALKAEDYRVRALSGVARLVNSKGEAASDELLAAVFLLERYEVGLLILPRGT